MGRNHTFWDSEFENNKYNESDHGEFQRNLLFVAMPFIEAMDDVFQAIEEEAFKFQLNTIRVDKIPGSSLVLKRITKAIENAEFLIFDLTNERPNVYYEPGYAHDIGNEGDEILLIAKEGTTIHFDLEPLKITYYDSIEDLKSNVYYQLMQIIRISRNKESNY
ncbi:MAG: hypothetical protein QE277_11605 [Flectobacillus sp.]|nr:hypothetical protein [Flectobacillus sp.]